MNASNIIANHSKLDIYQSRINKLRGELAKAEIDILILNPGPSLVYFTGMHYHLSERPVLALFGLLDPVLIFVPELERRKTENLSFPINAICYGEDPASWQAAFNKVASLLPGVQKNLINRIAIEPRRLRYLEYEMIVDIPLKVEIDSAEPIISSLRMYKDEGEVLLMQKAVEIAETALQNTIKFIDTGLTEKDIASELTQQLLKAGSDPVLPFFPIVSAGSNSANPHAVPTDRDLKPGELLVIDFGATYGGYISDITRTFAVGEVDQELMEIAEIVHRSNSAGRNQVRPSVKACEIDRAVRSIIVNAGYGENFTHRTGHGIGMEGHEPPYIRNDNPQTILSGMTFTIEPGIYLPGKGGVRIEDNILVTEANSTCLTSLPRELIKL